ncbi:hypothetical protein MNBD_GAMMA22-2439 [hydrothermal vent metagenome]|uniref:Uncharacterized protein n=1 Tax=hydrothermal vent metagenome TaxID=652676 RepID=A0A3B1AZJ1_9ZZZZ
MKKLSLTVATLLLSTTIATAAPVEAVEGSGTEGQINVQILSMTSNDDKFPRKHSTFLYLSNGVVVHIPKRNKMNTTLALSAFVTKKPVTIWTYIPEANNGPVVLPILSADTNTFWKGPSIGDGTTSPALRVHRIDVLTK